MSIRFLQGAEVDSLQSFEQWLKREGFSFAQIAQVSEVSIDTNCFDHLPCIARIILDDGESRLVVLVDSNDKLIVWDTLEDNLDEGAFDESYWAAVGVLDDAAYSDDEARGGDERFIAHESAMLVAENRVGYPGDAIFDKGYIDSQRIMEEG